VTSTADRKVETAADKVQAVVDDWQRAGGVKAKIAEALADDPAFLRKLKPSLIAARARGEAPTDQAPSEPAEVRHAPSGPQLERPRARPTPNPGPKKSSGGPNPFVVIAAALAVGVIAAKILDWRGHAHPRG
jgi:hypothetical protein